MIDDGKAADIVLAHDGEDVADGLLRRDGDRVEHHAGLRLLDRLDLAGLIDDRQVFMDDADTARLGHDDRRR